MAQECYFVTRTPKCISVEVIERNDAFWEKTMLPKLTRFYMKALLPEILDPRRPRGMEIREAPYVIEAQAVKARQKENEALLSMDSPDEET